MTRVIGQPERAAVFLAEALDLCRGREESDPSAYVCTMFFAGRAALEDGDLASAEQYFETTLAVARKLAQSSTEVHVLCHLATLARERGDRDWEEALISEASMAAGPEPDLLTMLPLRRQKAELLLSGGDGPGAAAMVRQTLTLLRGKARSFRSLVYPYLLLLADTELSGSQERGRSERAARLLGAATAVAGRRGHRAPDRAERERDSRLRKAVVEHLGLERFAEEEAAGSALDDEAALEFALEFASAAR